MASERRNRLVTVKAPIYFLLLTETSNPANTTYSSKGDDIRFYAYKHSLPLALCIHVSLISRRANYLLNQEEDRSDQSIISDTDIEAVKESTGKRGCCRLFLEAVCLGMT